MALKCECGGEIRKTIDNKDECLICGIAKKGDDKMAKEHDFKIEKVSGTATVIDNGKTFTTYRKFAKASGYEEAVHHFTELKEGEKVRLLAKGEHEYAGYGTVYVIETYKGVRHLIGHRGIKIDEPAQIPEQTYAEIAEPFGKHFRDAIREAYARGYEDGKRIGEMMREETPQEKVCDVQRQRDRIIEKAKKDIENIFIEGYHGVGKVVDTMFGHCTVEFVVNKEKRTVVALLRGAYAQIIGVAKCAPNDCFNVHIGKAVALRKALEKDIVDYMDVPNPTDVRVGDIARYPNGRIVEIINRDNDRIRVRTVETGEINSATSLAKVEIIDDSREVSE